MGDADLKQLCMKLYSFLPALQHQGFKQESVNDVPCKELAVREFLTAETESEGNIHKHLSNIYGIAVFDRSTVGCWVKRVMASVTGKAEVHDLSLLGYPVTAVTVVAAVY